eukprot:1155672-Pelagomonas_calceolata.AAC.7
MAAGEWIGNDIGTNRGSRSLNLALCRSAAVQVCAYGRCLRRHVTQLQVEPCVPRTPGAWQGLSALTRCLVSINPGSIACDTAQFGMPWIG